MKAMHVFAPAALVAVLLGSGPALAATTPPTADEAQKIVAQAVTGRAVTTLFCTAMKMNQASKPVVDYFRTIGFGVLTMDGQEFNLTRNGRILIGKVQSDWERQRKATDPQQESWVKMSSAPGGCTRLPLGLYTVGAVSNIRPGDSDQTALVDYAFTVVPTSLGDVLVKHNSDPMVDADTLVGIPERPVFLSYLLDRAKPLTAQAKLVFDGTWKLAP
jgi:hypothetical protein